jgi:hypothetical protein
LLLIETTLVTQAQADSQLIVRVLIEGAIGAIMLSVIAFLLSCFTRDIVGRSLLVILLFAAAGAYFGFAGGILPRPNPIWLLIELVQVIIFGSLALLGWRGSPYWIAAGWALHPFWDAWHYIGPGQSFAPMAYAVACFSFDLIVAVFIILAYGLGLLGGAE